MSVEDYQVSFSLEVNAEPAYQSVRRVQTVIYRLLGLFRRLGLPESLDEQIMKWQRFIMVINQARLAVAAFQAATGPLGILLGVVGAASTAVAVAEMSVDS